MLLSIDTPAPTNYNMGAVYGVMIISDLLQINMMAGENNLLMCHS